jgi:prepilin-type N-terminal cleavage/methylation domain-containing protein/prepilin-type processing-associated H-X9-DG protein
MKRKGFTLVELLVVIAIIALLMGILMPALARVRQIAFRMVCGTNLSGIGKAMLIYANDYEDELPRAGGRGTLFNLQILPQWMNPDRVAAFGLDPTTGAGGSATLTSCFYLLVKYSEVTPKSFICKGDSAVSEFKLANHGYSDRELIDVWDFGGNEEGTGDAPDMHCSYSYHLPFNLSALTTASDPGMAVAADRSPWWPPRDATELGDAWNLFDPLHADTTRQMAGNGIAHQGDGQNVLFMDGHVTFERRSYCAIDNDNIYTHWPLNVGQPTRQQREKGEYTPVPAVDQPIDRRDSYLINNAAAGGAAPPPPPR